MTNKEQLIKIANRCSQHKFIDDNALTSSVNEFGEVQKSCANCIHFTSDGRCNINLADEILTNMAMELDYE